MPVPFMAFASGASRIASFWRRAWACAEITFIGFHLVIVVQLSMYLRRTPASAIAVCTTVCRKTVAAEQVFSLLSEGGSRGLVRTSRATTVTECACVPGARVSTPVGA